MKLPANSPQVLPGLDPARDERFSSLLDSCVAGTLPVYFAAVPLALCIPFDVDYQPDQHPVGAAALAQTRAAWSKGQFSTMVVYPRGKWFIVSDDYIPLFAALTGLPDYVPCWILGNFDNDLVRDVQGPVNAADFARAQGLQA